MMNRIAFACLASLSFALAPQTSWAGRPLATDDASTTGNQHYQLEAWQDHADGNHTTTLAPAIGFGNFEFGYGYSQSHGKENQVTRDRSGYIKWAQETSEQQTARMGLKFWIDHSRDASNTEHPLTKAYGGMTILSWTLTPGLVTHFNLGMVHDDLNHRYDRITNAAIAWNPIASVQVSLEALHQRYSPTTQSVGLRYWAIQDKLGLDLTGSRKAGVSNSRSIGFGFGWYGDFGS